MASTRRSFLLSAASAALSPPATPLSSDALHEADQRALLDGVTEIVAPGCLPGPLALCEGDAFALVAGKDGETFAPLVAAARWGRGRVVALGHEGFFSRANRGLPGNVRFVANVLRWVSGEIRPREAGRSEFEAALAAQMPGKRLLFADTSAPLRCVVIQQDDLRGATAQTLQALRKWVRDGGGLIIGGPAWGWKQTQPGKTLARDHSGNRLLRPLGILFADGTLSATGKAGWRAEKPQALFDLDALNAVPALRLLTRFAEGTVRLRPGALEQATQTVGLTLATVSADDPFARRVTELTARHAPAVLPTPETPLGRDQPFARLAVLGQLALMETRPETLRALASAASFPGAVPPDAPRAAKTLTINPAVRGWHSTGLYAPPGVKITVTVPASAAGQWLAVRIGAHTDHLTHLAAWKRYPVASVRRDLTRPQTVLANPLGGAVFVEVPARLALTAFDIQVTGAVEAPLFVRGSTLPDEWRKARKAPGPWAELVGKRIALSVPSSVVRDLDDADALMRYWDAVGDACADLYGISRERERPERYVADVQISAGYMHSGYPIMTGLDVAARFTDLSVLTGPDGNLTWGFYHELGHNHQRPAWTWDGCGEVTNNLFSLYASEQFNRAYQSGDYLTTHPAVKPEERHKRWEAYKAAGTPYEQWKRDPFLALGTFIELRQGFGWEPFKTVFAEYEALPRSEQPRTDLDKRDQFMLRFGRIVGKDLGPFFTRWGIPTSAAARKAASGLPSY